MVKSSRLTRFKKLDRLPNHIQHPVFGAGQLQRIGNYAGHIEVGTKKQTDYLACFWSDKLDLIEGHEFIPEIINQEK